MLRQYPILKHNHSKKHGKIHTIFQEAGVAPNTYILDNEFSKDIRTTFQDENIEYILFLRTIIVQMRQNGQFKPSKAILFLAHQV